MEVQDKEERTVRKPQITFALAAAALFLIVCACGGGDSASQTTTQAEVFDPILCLEQQVSSAQR